MTRRKSIPGYSLYSIDTKGVVINNKSGLELAVNINGSGYLCVSIVGDNGKRKTFGIHRLLMMTFKPIPGCEELIVNHRNGIKLVNRLSNLEWATYTENTEHAGANGLTTKCKPVSVMDSKTREVFEYPSATACGRILGLTKDAVLWRVRSNGSRVFPDGFQYRITGEVGDWPDLTSAKVLFGQKRSVEIYNPRNGHTFEFESLTDTAKFLKLNIASLSKWINDPSQPLIPGYWMIKWSCDNSPWRPVEDVHIELSETTGEIPVITIAKNGKTISVFESLSKCAKHFKVPKSNLSYWCKTSKFVDKTGCSFRKYVIE